MQSELAAGTTLIVDRYAYSGVAFTAAKGDLSIEWCKAPDRGLPAPDAVFYLDISIEEAKKRGDYGAERYEKEGFQRKVYAMYQKLRCAPVVKLFNSHFPPRDDTWINVDAARTPEQVHEDLVHLAQSMVKKCAEKPVSLLWSPQ